MNLLLNFVSQYWGLLVTLFCSGIVFVYTAIAVLTERARQKKTALAMDILGATGRPEIKNIPLSILKATKTHASKGLVLLLVFASGYLVSDVHAARLEAVRIKREASNT